MARRAPTLGEHTEEILRHVLGYSDERIGDLRATRGSRLRFGPTGSCRRSGRRHRDRPEMGRPFRAV